MKKRDKILAIERANRRLNGKIKIINENRSDYYDRYPETQLEDAIMLLDKLPEHFNEIEGFSESVTKLFDIYNDLMYDPREVHGY